MSDLPPTGFPATARAVRQAFAGARLDAASFGRPLSPCSLAACGGTCCYDGVYVNPEVAAVLEHLAHREAPFFRSVGLDLPDPVIVEEPGEDGASYPRTALRHEPFHREVEGYPEHFADTACAFLLADARCGLQVLAEARGLHPWHYKPMACWLHPISLSPEEVVLHDAATDPYAEGGCGGFSSATPCGRTDPCGRPAARVLRPELEHLGAWLGRDLLAELAGGADG